MEMEMEMNMNTEFAELVTKEEMSAAFAALAAQTDEISETMAPPTAWITDAMREHWRNRAEAWLAERGMEASVASRWYGPLICNITQLPDITEEPPLPPAMEPPDPPNLTPTRRMAERAYDGGLLFWWPDPAPGIIYALWNIGSWESVLDSSPENQAGFEWLRESWDRGFRLGDALGPEQHGMGLVRETDEAVWIVAPSDLAVFVLLSNSTWQLVEP
ncbi:MAG: hypothetical protein OCU12_05985 [Methanophagales archaeon]|nr:hypothetical protein [Methanophagales archaeon]